MINHYYDIVSSGVFCILRKESEILINLPEIVKKRIDLLYNMIYDNEFFGESRIVNPCVEESCKILGIKSAPIKITQEKLIEYFNPKEDPYSFKIE